MGWDAWIELDGRGSATPARTARTPRAPLGHLIIDPAPSRHDSPQIETSISVSAPADSLLFWTPPAYIRATTTHRSHQISDAFLSCVFASF